MKCRLETVAGDVYSVLPLSMEIGSDRADLNSPTAADGPVSRHGPGYGSHIERVCRQESLSLSGRRSPPTGRGAAFEAAG